MFRWEYLTEKVAYEKRVRENKLKAALQQAKRENAEFVELIEKNKIVKQIEDRKRKKGEIMDENDAEKIIKRKFKQQKVFSDKEKSKISKSLIEKISKTS